VTNRRKNILLRLLLLVFIIVAIWGYCFEPIKEPFQVAFATKGGSVIFNHFNHASPDVYNISCVDCHHDYKPESEDLDSMNCRECHYSNEPACSDESVHTRCIGKNCVSCHIDGSVPCSFCHRVYDLGHPEAPEEIEFKTDQGDVIFDHATHADLEEGYDLACNDCHHNYKPEHKKPVPMNCRRCHYNTKYESICEEDDNHMRCIGKNCIDCHTDGAEDCEICHQ